MRSVSVALAPHLEPCFIDGQIEFDNNLTENAIRPTKLGHKNWLHIGGAHTGWRSAVIRTIVEQLRRHRKDPFAWFEWVFGKLMHHTAPEELPGLLPGAVIKAQSNPAIGARTAVASQPEMRNLWQKCESCSVNRLRRICSSSGSGSAG